MKLFGRHIPAGLHGQGSSSPLISKDLPYGERRAKKRRWSESSKYANLWENLEWVVLGVFFLYFMYVLYLLFLPSKSGF